MPKLNVNWLLRAHNLPSPLAPSSDEPKQPLLVKVAQALQQILEKLDTSTATQPAPHGLTSPSGKRDGACWGKDEARMKRGGAERLSGRSLPS